MLFPRAPFRQTAQLSSQSLRPTPNAPRTRSWQKVKRRTYANARKPSPTNLRGDIPWAIGAVTVTVPSVWYLISERIKSRRKFLSEDHSVGDQEQLQYIYDTSKGASEDVINNRINEMVLRTRRAKEFILADYEKRKQAANQDHTTDEDSEHQEVADKDGAKDGDGDSEHQEVADEDGAEDGDGDSEHQEVADEDGAKDGDSEHQEAVDKDDATDKDGNDFEKPQSESKENLPDTNAQHSEYHVSKPDMSQKPGGELETSKAKGVVNPTPANVEP